MDKQVRVIHIGRGEVVSNWGTHEGVPAVFIEPVIGEPGPVGDTVSEGIQPQLANDTISDGGVVIVIHDRAGLNVLIEDLHSALSTDRLTDNEKQA